MDGEEGMVCGGLQVMLRLGPERGPCIDYAENKASSHMKLGISAITRID